MNTENIFLDAERWSQYSHPAKELEHLRSKATPDQIKNYFLHRQLSAHMLRRISNRQMQKIDTHLPSPKIKLILKEKSKRLPPVPRHQFDILASLPSSKSSSRSNTWEEEDQEVSQYLNFEGQELPPLLLLND